jgi:hypothetical protein
VIIPETPEHTAEVIAEDISRIAEGVRKLRAGRLNDRALVILLSASTGISKSTIEIVLNGLTTLDGKYLRK